MEQRLKQLERAVAELSAWKEEREKQQIKFPIDPASRVALGAPYGEGAGSTSLTQSVSVPSTPTSINVPAAYVQSVLVVIDGVRYEFPSLI